MSVVLGTDATARADYLGEELSSCIHVMQAKSSGYMHIDLALALQAK